VVAGMGTALTEQQLRQIKRHASNITLALDPDAAGDHATLRGLETARQTLERQWEPVMDPSGLVRQESRLKAQVRIATLPAGLDPDELARSNTEQWKQVIAQAPTIVDYYLGVVSREEDLTSAHGKAQAVERLAPLIREIANQVERAHYVQRLARLIEVDERTIVGQISAAGQEQARRRAAQPAAEAEAQSEPVGAPGRARKASGPQAIGLEEHILSHLLVRHDLLARLDADMASCEHSPLAEEDFGGGENRAILAALRAAQPAGQDAGADRVLDSMPEALQSRCLALSERARRSPRLSDDSLAKDLADTVLRLRERNLRTQVSRLHFLIGESEATGLAEQLGEYKGLAASYASQQDNIQHLLNARTLTGALARQKTRPAHTNH
jgi:DNA primase